MKITPGKGLLGQFNYPIQDKQFSGSIFASEIACNTTRVLVAAPVNNNTAVANFTTLVSQPNKVDVDATASNGQNVAWNFGDGNTGTGLITNHTYINGGSYTITCVVEDTVCNSFDTATFNVQMTIGVTENELSRSLNIFPNPSTGEFTIAFDLEKAQDITISVVDALGREISNEIIARAEGATQHKLDLTNQARGLYFVKITAGENTIVKKITKL